MDITKARKMHNPAVITGTSMKTRLIGVTYDELVEALGEPSFPEPSFDGKIQVEWAYQIDEPFENPTYTDEVVTLYDWKTYDREFTLNELDVWHIGSKLNRVAYDFHDMVMLKVTQNRLKKEEVVS